MHPAELRLDCAGGFSQPVYQYSCRHAKPMGPYSLWVMHHRGLADGKWLQRIRYLPEPDHCLGICRHRTPPKQDLFLDRPEMVGFVHRTGVPIRWRYHDTCGPILMYRGTSEQVKTLLAGPSPISPMKAEITISPISNRMSESCTYWHRRFLNSSDSADRVIICSNSLHDAAERSLHQYQSDLSWHTSWSRCQRTHELRGSCPP